MIKVYFVFTINYRRNPLQILMYKFVYTTMTSYEYDNFLKLCVFFFLDMGLTVSLVWETSFENFEIRLGFSKNAYESIKIT